MNLKNKLKNCAYLALNFFSLFGFYKNNAIILMYHSISNNDDFFCVKPIEFEKQMNFLKINNFNVISLNKLIWHLEKNNLPPKTVILTFDDGFEDNFTKAFMILKKHNFSATIFLETEVLGREKSNKSGIIYKMLNWDQIKEMKMSGMIDFGAHTLSHPKLSQLSWDSAESEILQSKKILESKLQKKCDFFAYPFGNYNKEVVKITKACDFKAAVTVKNGVVKKNDDIFTLKRNSVDSLVCFSKFKNIVKFGVI